MSELMSNDAWLLIALAVFDGVVLLFIWGALLAAFPKRIREGMTKNSIRLNGTPSRRRRKIEQFEFQGLMWRSMFVVAILLFLCNGAVCIWHVNMVPVDITGQALGHIDLQPSKWKEALNDPASGMVSKRYETWRDSKNLGVSTTLARAMGSFVTVSIVAFGLFLAVLFSLCHQYVKSLVNFETRLLHRHQNYLYLDMDQRFDDVEKAKADDRRERKRRHAVPN